jgi:hypothetical protein
MFHTTLAVKIQLDSSQAALELEEPAAPGVTDPPVVCSEHHAQGRHGW